MNRAEEYLRSRFLDVEAELEAKLIGEKVACIDDSFTDEQIAKCDALPVRGGVYTIRAIRVRYRDDTPEPSLLLDEIVNTRLIFGEEPGFWFSRFEHTD